MASASRRPRVLAVNTDNGVLALIASALQALGCETVTVRLADLNAEGGLLAYVAKLLPDAIVYDVGPPYVENWTRLEGVLASGTVTAPVIVTSTDPQALEAHVQGRVAGLVGKPFEIDALASSVRAALDHHGDPAAASS